MRRIWIFLALVGSFAILTLGYRFRVGLYLKSLLASEPRPEITEIFEPLHQIEPHTLSEKGQVLLLHGLNLNPQRMEDLGQSLSRQGYRAFRGALFGHRTGFSEMKIVTRQRWMDDVTHMVRIMNESSGAGERVGLGFSLGGLLIVAHQIERNSFSKMILLAPAITPRVSPWVVDLAKWILPQGFELPSPIPAGYGRYKKTSLNQNVALFDVVKAVQTAPSDRLQIPTLVLGDPEDEMVSWEGIKAFSRERLLPWQFEEVSVEGTQLPRKIHHQIFDRPSLGDVEWDRMNAKIRKFLEE